MTTPTPTEIRVIVKTSLTDDEVQSMIEDASVMVGPCTLAVDCATKRVIIKYVTAHMIASLGASVSGAKTLTQRSLGDASESYGTAPLAAGLAGTLYGQQALMLDPTGCLANLGKRRGWAKTL